MSLSQQTTQRLPTIKTELLKGTSYIDIGKKLNVTERTIDRDIKAFVNSGDFETWLKEEWLRLHNQVIHDDPIEAYRNVSKLISRMITQKRELTVDESLTERQVVEIDLSKLSDSDKQALDTAARILEVQSKREPISIH